MSDLWSYDTVRVITFVILFVCFFVLVYRGAFKLVFDRENFYWDRFMNLVWCTVICIAIGDVLYQKVEGGWRIWLIFAASCLQLYIVLFRSPYYERENGHDDIRP